MTFRLFWRHMFQSSARVGDISDRLNNVCFLVILLLSVLAYHQTYIRNPLSCWCPAEFKGSMVEYTNNICWESDYHYYLPYIDAIPHRRIMKQRKPPLKWFPLILALQALMFKVPDMILIAGQRMFGFQFQKVLGLVDGYSNLNFEDRSAAARQLGRYVKVWLKSSTVKGIPWGPLTFVCVLTKLFCFINSLTQLTILDKRLRVDNHTTYIEQFTGYLINGSSQWQLFPRIFSCDFKIRKLATIQDYTVQCVNNTATFYEGLFCFMWVLLFFTVVLTAISLLLHGFKVIIPIFRRRYVKQYLTLSEDIGAYPQDHMVADFASSVTEDGIYILKAIGETSSEQAVRDTVVYLWNSKYQPRYQRISGDPNMRLVPSSPPAPHDDMDCGGKDGVARSHGYGMTSC